MLLCCSLIVAEGRKLHMKHSRRLQQACPIEHCASGSCTVRPGSRSSCAVCEGPRIPNSARTECVCPPGTLPTGRGSCTNCKPNFYCPAAATNKLVHIGKLVKQCPKHTVTRGPGAKSVTACLNTPGYRMAISRGRSTARKDASATAEAAAASPVLPAATVSEVATTTAGAAAAGTGITVWVMPCGPDEYSEGLDGSTSCTPCPPGFKTDPENEIGSHTSAAVCMAPPGFFVEGNTVVPCPAGSFSSTYSHDTACTACEDVFGPGLTTAGAGSDSSAACTVLQPGYALVSNRNKAVMNGTLDLNLAPQMFGAATKACPQSFYCPGGDAAAAGQPQACPRGMMTEGQGAVSQDECMAPPGWFLPLDGSSSIQECQTGTYKQVSGEATVASAVPAVTAASVHAATKCSMISCLAFCSVYYKGGRRCSTTLASLLGLENYSPCALMLDPVTPLQHTPFGLERTAHVPPPACQPSVVSMAALVNAVLGPCNKLHPMRSGPLALRQDRSCGPAGPQHW